MAQAVFFGACVSIWDLAPYCEGLVADLLVLAGRVSGSAWAVDGGRAAAGVVVGKEIGVYRMRLQAAHARLSGAVGSAGDRLAPSAPHSPDRAHASYQLP